MTEQTNLIRAQRKVAAIKGFYIHLCVFVLVMALLLAINAATGPQWWVQWPLLGWGIGIVAHAATVFGRSVSVVSNWETRKIAEVKRRLDERG